MSAVSRADPWLCRAVGSGSVLSRGFRQPATGPGLHRSYRPFVELEANDTQEQEIGVKPVVTIRELERIVLRADALLEQGPEIVVRGDQ